MLLSRRFAFLLTLCLASANVVLAQDSSSNSPLDEEIAREVAMFQAPENPPQSQGQAPQPAPGQNPGTVSVQSRIKARRAELVAQLRELRADRRLEAGEAGDKLKARLSELSHLLKWGVVDGWASLGDKVKDRLEHWLAESKHQLPTQGGPARTVQS